MVRAAARTALQSATTALLGGSCPLKFYLQLFGQLCLRVGILTLTETPAATPTLQRQSCCSECFIWDDSSGQRHVVSHTGWGLAVAKLFIWPNFSCTSLFTQWNPRLPESDILDVWSLASFAVYRCYGCYSLSLKLRTKSHCGVWSGKYRLHRRITFNRFIIGEHHSLTIVCDSV